jgi:hypothetical protein
MSSQERKDSEEIRNLLIKGLDTNASPVEAIFDQLIDLLLLLANACQQGQEIEEPAQEFEPVFEFQYTPSGNRWKRTKEQALTDQFFQLPKFARYRTELRGRLRETDAHILYALAGLVAKLRRGKNLRKAFMALCRTFVVTTDESPPVKSSPQQLLPTSQGQNPKDASHHWRERKKVKSSTSRKAGKKI